MQQLQVPTRTISVQVCSKAEGWLRGCLFATPCGHEESDAEALGRLLNDDRAFLPFLTRRLEDEMESILVSKEHLIRVRLAAHAGGATAASSGLAGEPPGAGEEAPAPRLPESWGCLLLVDGTRLAGEVEEITPRTQPRLLDKLNHADQFMEIHTQDGIEFIRRRHIVRVTGGEEWHNSIG